MSKRSNIFLVGPMGAGKSTIGRQLARRLSMEFYDTDHEIERRTGVDIPLIFDIEGEAGFRRRECQVLEELTALSNIVLATGGGAVLDPDNRARLKQRGFVVYLQATPEQLLRRTVRDTHRPLLQTGDRAGRIRQLLEEREPYYREVADLIINSDRLTVGHAIGEISRQFVDHEHAHG
jgi:shikimate kinase